VDDEVDPVRHQGREAIARLKAEPAVATGQRGARPVELAPAERAVGRNDRDFVRGGIEAGPQQVIQRRGRGFEPGTLEQDSLDPTRVPPSFGRARPSTAAACAPTSETRSCHRHRGESTREDEGDG
jgi:hypothetical protein